MPATKNMTSTKETVFILSASSDIGCALAQQYLAGGCRVVGTYRDFSRVKGIKENKDCLLFPCDIAKEKDVAALKKQLIQKKIQWDTFISCVGQPTPLSTFFESDFSRWSDSVYTNSLGQLRVLHAIYPFRKKNKTANVAFFAGPATNNSIVHMSAYAISKIMLIKMCELLDSENKDLNVFIVGPGWTRTKTHYEILADKDIDPVKYRLTVDFLKSKKGTSFEDIFNCIRWLCCQGKSIASGRNFSIVHDPWKEPTARRLKEALRADPHMYKLRRFRNNFLTTER